MIPGKLTKILELNGLLLACFLRQSLYNSGQIKYSKVNCGQVEDICTGANQRNIHDCGDIE